MADVKVSALPELAAGDLDPAADFLLVSDMSASASKKMKASEMIRAALPYLATFWDFATGSLLPSVSFTRASTGWRYNSAGVIVPETTNVARFQYDPATLAARGLLIEDAATNAAQRSEEIDNAYWAKAASSVTANAAVAPDGATAMDRITENTANNNHGIKRANYPWVSGTTYAISFFAKAETRSWLSIFVNSTAFTTNQRTYFDLTNGVVGTTGPNTTAFIQHVGGGIYRCTAICTATATTNQDLVFDISTNGVVINYVGDGTSSLLIWGISVTEVSASSSYIPTTTAAVTRAADIANITNPQALADQCWIVRARTPRRISGGAVNVAFQADDGSGNNRRTLHYGTDGRLHVIATVSGVDQCDLDLGAVANDTDFAVAIRWANNNFAASLNGGAIVTDLSGQNPIGLTAARIGRSSSGNYWNSTIRTIETRRTATDTELPLLAA